MTEDFILPRLSLNTSCRLAARAAADAVCRLRGGGSYCSGVLSTPLTIAKAMGHPTGSEDSSPQFVLTARHFIADQDDITSVTVTGRTFHSTITGAKNIPLTDISVVKLDKPVPEPIRIPAVASTLSRPWLKTVTMGFGGLSNTNHDHFACAAGQAQLVMAWPWMISWNGKIKVRHAGLNVFPGHRRIIKGDSGGPVLHAQTGEVIGLQSLILPTPVVSIATVALLPKHLHAISCAMATL